MMQVIKTFSMRTWWHIHVGLDGNIYNSKKEVKKGLIIRKNVVLFLHANIMGKL